GRRPGSVTDTRRGERAGRGTVAVCACDTAGRVLTAALAAIADGAEAVIGNGRLLDVGGAHGTQVVGSLQAALPGQLVQLVELAPGRFGHVQVQALRLIQPFLPPRGRFHQPAGVDLERALV